MKKFLNSLKNRDFLTNKYNHLLYVLLLCIIIYPTTIKDVRHFPILGLIVFIPLIPALRASTNPKTFHRLLCFPIIMLFVDFFS